MGGWEDGVGGGVGSGVGGREGRQQWARYGRYTQRGERLVHLVMLGDMYRAQISFASARDRRDSLHRQCDMPESSRAATPLHLPPRRGARSGHSNRRREPHRPSGHLLCPVGRGDRKNRGGAFAMAVVWRSWLDRPWRSTSADERRPPHGRSLAARTSLPWTSRFNRARGLPPSSLLASHAGLSALPPYYWPGRGREREHAPPAPHPGPHRDSRHLPLYPLSTAAAAPQKPRPWFSAPRPKR